MGSASQSQVAQPNCPNGPRPSRRFDFSQDTFAFPNELVWKYVFDSATGQTKYLRRNPTPDYAHRCFVLARAAKQFFLHARFEPTMPLPNNRVCRDLIRSVMRRNPRFRRDSERQIIFPGYSNLREFSTARADLLKGECGGAWRSYLLRSHWRMVLPFTARHQMRTAHRLAPALRSGAPAIVHLVRFPKISINHGMVLYDVKQTPNELRFPAYDPNRPEKPSELIFRQLTRSFFLEANDYWAGGELKVMQIYRNLFF
jgi:hypothetical protein